MGKMQHLTMSNDPATSELIQSDLNQILLVVKNLTDHAVMLATVGVVGFGTTFLKSVAAIAAIYLLILDRTHWKTNMHTSLLVPYIFLSLPNVVFTFLRGEFGTWVAFITVVLRLFFPQRFPGWLVMPGSLVILLVVSPGLFASTVRESWIGATFCLLIGCYLLQQHIHASGGFKNSYTQRHAVSNSMGIVLLFVYPIWRLVVYVL